MRGRTGKEPGCFKQDGAIYRGNGMPEGTCGSGGGRWDPGRRPAQPFPDCLMTVAVAVQGWTSGGTATTEGGKICSRQ